MSESKSAGQIAYEAFAAVMMFHIGWKDLGFGTQAAWEAAAAALQPQPVETGPAGLVFLDGPYCLLTIPGMGTCLADCAGRVVMRPLAEDNWERGRDLLNAHHERIKELKARVAEILAERAALLEQLEEAESRWAGIDGLQRLQRIEAALGIDK